MKHWFQLVACGAVVGFGCSTKTQNFDMCSDVEMDCNGACVSVASDPRNCGGCGIQCKSGQACVTGLCGCAQGMMVCGAAFNFNKTTSQYWRVFVKNNWGYQSYIAIMEVGFYGCL